MPTKYSQEDMAKFRQELAARHAARTAPSRPVPAHAKPRRTSYVPSSREVWAFLGLAALIVFATVALVAAIIVVGGN